ncbi:MAG: methyltransferase [Ferruginibacter sp.]
MKVCTDACLFGAWVVERLRTLNILPARVLDIGTGTGLLSLMLAQETNASVDAVEINSDVATQASQNIADSPWHNRISVFNMPVQDFNPGYKYNFIICNPPFYRGDLRSPDENRNTAKHDGLLSLEELIKIILKNISLEGHAAVMLPLHRTTFFEKICKQEGFFISEKLLVKQTPQHDGLRTLFLFSLMQKTVNNYNITIDDAERNYTPEFNALLKEYYLNL